MQVVPPRGVLPRILGVKVNAVKTLGGILKNSEKSSGFSVGDGLKLLLELDGFAIGKVDYPGARSRLATLGYPDDTQAEGHDVGGEA